MGYGELNGCGYRQHILNRDKNTNKAEVFTQEDQSFTGRKTFLSGITTSDLEADSIETNELTVNGEDISELAQVINYLPNDVSAENKLTSENFVNSSVSTNTAYFRGTFNSVEELEAYSGEKTNNDYAFVISEDDEGNTVYNRYKYNAEAEDWSFEYSLNNSSFTSEQWEAINSGITEELVELIGSPSALIDDSANVDNKALSSQATRAASYGAVCSSSADSAAKEITSPGFMLLTGAVVRVLFTNENTASDVTLNVNSTGAKAIKAVKAGAKIAPPVHSGKWRGATAYTDEMWQPYTTLELMYDGTDWVIMGNPELENWSNDTEGYIVKANGYIKQHGFVTHTDNINITVELKLKYSNNKYDIFCVPFKTSGTGGNYASTVRSNPAIDSFNLGTSGNGSWWQTIGY